MAKVVLTTKVSPTYDDLPEQQYHFPRTYLRQVEEALNDWCIYYEPRRPTGDLSSRGGRQSYFATARIRRIEADPAVPNHFYAFVTDYLPFNRPVRFEEDGFYYESGLQKADGSTNKGAFGRAVRGIRDQEYDLILQAGFAHILGSEPRNRPAPDVPEEAPHVPLGLAESPANWSDEEIALADGRPIIEKMIARPFRERAFSVSVKAAYRDTCAITGIKIINGMGRSEVQAAHIRPVAACGPDSVRNGIALSGTMHWMFDRGLVSIDDDYGILIARDKVPDTVERLIVAERRLLLPEDVRERPHRQFLRYHQREVFKG